MWKRLKKRVRSLWNVDTIIDITVDFLLLIERTKVEGENEKKKIYSICKFDFIDKVKSKNIDQNDRDLVLKLIAIDYLKNKKDYEINLIFTNNAYITLTAETIEVRLEDQSEIK